VGVVTSLLVLVSVVVLPLLSLLVDLALLDTQRTLRRITAIARQDQDPTPPIPSPPRRGI